MLPPRPATRPCPAERRGKRRRPRTNAVFCCPQKVGGGARQSVFPTLLCVFSRYGENQGLGKLDFVALVRALASVARLIVRRILQRPFEEKHQRPVLN